MCYFATSSLSFSPHSDASNHKYYGSINQTMPAPETFGMKIKPSLIASILKIASEPCNVINVDVLVINPALR